LLAKKFALKTAPQICQVTTEILLSYNEMLQRYSVKLHRRFQSYSDGAQMC